MKIDISGFYDEYSGSLDEQIKIIKELGEKYLCPRGIDGKNIGSYTADEFIASVKPKLDKAGIKFSSIGSPIGKIKIDDEEGYQKQLNMLKELVKIANVMDCKYIRMFSFFMPKGEDPHKYREIVIDKLKGFLDVVQDSDIILLHENEKHIYGDNDTRCKDLYESINHPQFKLIYDASNFIQCKVDPVKAFDLLKDYVIYYHIKDCDAETGVEVPLGMGDGNYEYIFSKLAKRKYQGFMTMEPHTLKYALVKRAFYLLPISRLIMPKWYKGFRKIDKALNKKMLEKVTREEIFLIQYNNLKKMLSEVK